MAEDGKHSMSDAALERDIDEARTFGILIAGLEDGQLNQDLTQAVSDIVARLHDTERDQGGSPSGTLTLKLAMKLDGGVIEIKGSFTAAMPKEVRPKSVYWATPNNNLTRRNPKQREFPFAGPRPLAREVSGAGEIRKVN